MSKFTKIVENSFHVLCILFTCQWIYLTQVYMPADLSFYFIVGNVSVFFAAMCIAIDKTMKMGAAQKELVRDQLYQMMHKKSGVPIRDLKLLAVESFENGVLTINVSDEALERYKAKQAEETSTTDPDRPWMTPSLLKEEQEKTYFICPKCRTNAYDKCDTCGTTADKEPEQEGVAIPGSKLRWVPITTEEQAQEETRQMVHAIVHYFRGGRFAHKDGKARYYSLRNGTTSFVTAMFHPDAITIVGKHNLNPWKQFSNEILTLAACFPVELATEKPEEGTAHGVAWKWTENWEDLPMPFEYEVGKVVRGA